MREARSPAECDAAASRCTSASKPYRARSAGLSWARAAAPPTTRTTSSAALTAASCRSGGRTSGWMSTRLWPATNASQTKKRSARLRASEGSESGSPDPTDTTAMDACMGDIVQESKKPSTPGQSPARRASGRPAPASWSLQRDRVSRCAGVRRDLPARARHPVRQCPPGVRHDRLDPFATEPRLRPRRSAHDRPRRRGAAARPAAFPGRCRRDRPGRRWLPRRSHGGEVRGHLARRHCAGGLGCGRNAHAERHRRVGRRASLVRARRAAALAARGELRPAGDARSRQAHGRWQGAPALAQSQRPTHLEPLFPPLPQRVRGRGQHLDDRESALWRVPQQRADEEGRMGIRST